jgi:hypothetical protein
VPRTANNPLTKSRERGLLKGTTESSLKTELLWIKTTKMIVTKSHTLPHVRHTLEKKNFLSK